MKREDLEAWLVRRGYTKDRWGHYVKAVVNPTGEPRRYRYTLSRIAARREVQVVYGDGSKCWVRLRSGYYKNLELTPEDKLRGMKR